MISDAYARWAPVDSPWSLWVKPVLFADELMTSVNLGGVYDGATNYPVDQLPDRVSGSALIVDWPGEESVAIGLALARRGFRPVPLFNGVDGEPALVPVAGIVRALVRSAPELTALALPANAPPVFLLDSNRLNGPAQPNSFDNRWVVVPEDFPSANRLLAAGLRRCVLIARTQLPDLPHVLLRYRDAGIVLSQASDTGALGDLKPKRPLSFGTLFARALVLSGLRRSSAGGFGGLVPLPSQGGYG